MFTFASSSNSFITINRGTLNLTCSGKGAARFAEHKNDYFRLLPTAVYSGSEMLPILCRCFYRLRWGAFFVPRFAFNASLGAGSAGASLELPENRGFPLLVRACQQLLVRMVDLLVRTGRSFYNGLCSLFPVLGLSLNLRNGRNLIPRLRMSPVRTGHTFFCHVNTSISHFKVRLSSAYFVCFALYIS